MSEKIIFLDVDGVLNYMSYRNKSTANIDPSKVEMLAYICTQTNAKVVITSSWRGSETYTPRIYYILIDILKEHHVPVLGDAPHTIEIKTKGLLIHLSNSVHPALLRTLIESLKESLG